MTSSLITSPLAEAKMNRNLNNREMPSYYTSQSINKSVEELPVEAVIEDLIVGEDLLIEETALVEESVNSFDILIKFKDKNKFEKETKDKNKKIRSHKLKKEYKKYGIELITIESNSDINEVLLELSLDNNVEFVSENALIDIANDGSNIIEESGTIKNLQWYLNNPTRTSSGAISISLSDINSVDHWNINHTSPGAISIKTGDPSNDLSEVTVGVIDSGIDYSHQELVGLTHINSDEIPNNNIDDDNNGYIDDVYGWDFVNDDDTTYDHAIDDIHGTSVAGLITTNNINMKSVTSNVKLMPLKVFNGNSGYLSDVIEAISYAEDNGVQIVNCSWTTENNPFLLDIIRESEMIFVAAAGNDSKNIDVDKVYPASYNLPNVISVSSINELGYVSDFSNYGFSVDFVAPGENIFTTSPENQYDYYNGTSYSTALVSGILATYKGLNSEIDNNTLSEQFRQMYREVDSLNDTDMNRLIDFEAVISNEEVTIPTDFLSMYGDIFTNLDTISFDEDEFIKTLVNAQTATGEIPELNKIDYDKYTGFDNGLSFESSVNEASGSVNLSNSLINLKGIAGLDLNISLNYDSSRANIYQNKFNDDNLKYDVPFDRAIYMTQHRAQDLIKPEGSTKFVAFETTSTMTNDTYEDAAIDYYYNYDSWFDAGNNPDQLYNTQFPYLSAHYLSTGITFNYEDCTNDNINNTYLDSLNQVGEGWNFNFPSVEIDNSGETEIKYLHTSNGASYQIEQYFAQGKSNLVDYNLLDLIFDNDASTFTNGEEVSSYSLRHANGTIEYFALDGRYLGKVDKWGNEQVFYHELIDAKPVVTKILDSAGREIDFTYTTTGTDRTVDITVINPNGNDLTVSLFSEESSLYPGNYLLKSFIDESGEETSFEYSLDTGDYNFFDKDTADLQDNTTVYANISKVNYPSKLTENYTYEKVTGNLGNNGFKEYYRVLSSNSVDNSTIYNPISYTYVKERSGYPDYNYEKELPSSFIYETISANVENVISNSQYNSDGLMINNDVSYGTELISNTKKTYNSDKLPVEVISTTYDNNESNSVTVYSNTEYDEYGNVIYSWTPLAEGDMLNDEHKISYDYDSTYNMLLSVTYKQDADTTVQLVNTLDASLKSTTNSSLFENGVLSSKVDYIYNMYGNVINQKMYKDASENIEIELDYTDYNSNNTSKLNDVFMNKIILKGVKDADGNLVIDSLGNLSGEVSESQIYDWFGKQVSNTDRNGNDTNYTYDIDHRLISVDRHGTVLKTWSYDTENNKITTTDILDNSYITTFNGFYRPESIYDDTLGKTVKSIVYDNMLREETVDNIVSGEGNRVEINYDYLGNIIDTTTYDELNNILNSMIIEYENAYDNQYRRTKITVLGDSNSESITSYEYTDKYGNKALTSVLLDGVELYNVYEYDYINRVAEETQNVYSTSTTQPYTFKYEYDVNSNLLTTYDKNYLTIKSDYDFLGNTKSFYDKISTTTDNTPTITTEYDNLLRPIKVEKLFESDGDSNYYQISKMFYDNNSNVIKEELSSSLPGDTLEFSNREFEYDNNNNLVTVIESIDATNKLYTQYYYDEHNMLLRRYSGLSSPLTIIGLDNVVVGTDSDYTVTKYTYDNRGNLINRENPGNQQYISEFDDLMRLIKFTQPDGTYYTYSYDGLNNIVNQSAYSDIDALVKEYNFTYTTTGNIKTSEGEAEVKAYIYDELGRVTSIDINGTVNYAYGYDIYSNLIDFGIMKDSNKIYDQSYDYDEYHRLVTAYENDASIASYAYDNNNRNTSIDYANGTSTDIIYNLNGNVEMVTNNFNATQSTTNTYDYYLNGKIFEDIDSDYGTKQYTYDGLGRLLNELMSGVTTSFEYDDLSNMTSKYTDTITNSYYYNDKAQLISEVKLEGGNRTLNQYIYDLNGNQILKAESKENSLYDSLYEVTLFGMGESSLSLEVSEYDIYNRLVSGKTSELEYSYTYDVNNLRNSKEVDGIVNNYYWNNGNLVVDLIDDTYVNNKFYYGLDLISRFNGNTNKDEYYQHNGKLDVKQLIDDNGNRLKSYNYTSFGVEINADDLDDNPMRYKGEFFDEEIGEYYLRARFYNPRISRFRNVDTYLGSINNSLSHNLYTYCSSDPINYSDPSGNRQVEDAFGVKNHYEGMGKTDLNDWLTSSNTPTYPSGGSIVEIPSTANPNKWAMKEDQTKLNLYARPIIGDTNKVVIGSNGEMLDKDGRYWVAVGPKVMTPDFSIDKQIKPEDMKYGTLIDVVVSDSDGNTHYIKAVVGDAKNHTYPNGIYQTGYAFPNGTDPYPNNNDGSIVEFMGKGALTNLTDYKILKIIVYDNN